MEAIPKDPKHRRHIMKGRGTLSRKNIEEHGVPSRYSDSILDIDTLDIDTDDITSTLFISNTPDSAKILLFSYGCYFLKATYHLSLVRIVSNQKLMEELLDVNNKAIWHTKNAMFVYDFGSINLNDWRRSLLSSYLIFRYNHILPTFLSSDRMTTKDIVSNIGKHNLMSVLDICQMKEC